MIRKDIVINVSRFETRIAIIEDNVLVEFHIDRPEQLSLVGNIYKAKVLNLISGLKAAFVDLGLDKNGFLPLNEIPFEDLSDLFESEVELVEEYRPEEIRLKENQEIIVQVTKDSYGIKGPRVSSYISLPGRYVVLLVNAQNVGVSRKIRQHEERDQLFQLSKEIKPPDMGLIIRTAAAEAKPEELRNEVKLLKSEWEKGLQLAKKTAPVLIRSEPPTLFRVVRDLFNHEVRNLIVDSAEEYKKIIDYLGKVSPRLRSRVKLYRDSEPIFEKYGIEEQLKSIFERRIWLPSGSYIVLDHTEAFLAIDVNTGKSSKEKEAEKLALATNLEALKEIVRQLRLRDFGGLVVVDLIALEKKESVERLLREFKNLIREDRARYRIGGISEFGLLEFTRERSRTSLIHALSEVCAVCKGRARVLSKLSLLACIERWLTKNAKAIKNRIVELQVSPRIADYLSLHRAEILARFAKDYHLILRLRPDYSLADDDFKALLL